MAFFLAFFGILLIVAAYRNAQAELLAQLSDDGKHFIPWLLVLAVVGAVGLNKTMRPASNAFMVLIVIALFLRSGNQIFQNFSNITRENSL